MLYTIIIVIIVIAAILLGLVVLMQNSKGGGLTDSFASSQQLMGVRKTTDFMEKATWTIAIVIVVLSFVTSFMASSNTRKVQVQGSKANQVKTTAPIVQQPVMPTAPMPETPTTPED